MGLLQSLHNSARLTSSNEIPLDVGSIVDYVIGLQTLNIVLLVFIVISIVLLCLNKTLVFENIKYIYTVLIVVASATILCSLIGITTVFSVVKDKDVFINGVLDVVNDVLNFTKTLTETLEFIDSNISAIQTDCVGFITGTDLSSISDFSSGMSTTMNDVNSVATTVDDGINNYTSIVENYMNSGLTGSILFLVFNVLLIVLGWIVVMKAMTPKKCLVTTLNMVPIVLLSVITGVLTVISLLLSDVCYPSVDQTIRRILSKMIDIENVCNNDTYKELCYYQTCSGNNTVEEFLSQIGNMGESLSNFTLDYSSTPGLPIACQDSLTGLQTSVESVEFYKIVDLASCTRVNGLYSDIVHNALCDRIGVGFATTWLLLFISVIVLSISLATISCITYEYKKV